MFANLENQTERSTASHRLTRAFYGDVDSRQRERLSYEIMFSVFVDFTIYAVPITILSTHLNFNATCGIPLTKWLLGLLMIICVSNLQKLFMYTVVQNCRASRFFYGIFSSGLIFLCLFAWLVYGNILYYSRRNDCVRKKETRLLAYITLAYLYVGYIQIGYALSYAYIIPHALAKWWQLKSHQKAFHN